MKDKTVPIKTVLSIAGVTCLAIAALSLILGFLKNVLSGFPLPNFLIFFQGFLAVLLGFYQYTTFPPCCQPPIST